MPTYVIEGDPERGIEPMAPDLKSVLDLPDYWAVPRSEDPSKGGLLVLRRHGVTELMMIDQTYGLDEW